MVQVLKGDRGNPKKERGNLGGKATLPKIEMKKITILLIFILFTTVNCGGFKSVKLVPVTDPKVNIFPRTNSVGIVKDGIIVLAVPLNDVKEVDAFAIIIVNDTGHWIHLYKNKCVLLDQSGSFSKPIPKSQESLYLSKGFKPKLPLGFKEDVFNWKHGAVWVGDVGGLPLNDIEKTQVMPKMKQQFFLYFRKRSISSSRLTLIIPNVYNETEGKKTTFAFKFEVQKG